jgi:hypothetical protein
MNKFKIINYSKHIVQYNVICVVLARGNHVCANGTVLFRTTGGSVLLATTVKYMFCLDQR